MRQVFLDKGTIVVKEVCQPLLDDYSVLVSVHYSFISSGTESAAIAQARQTALFTNLPKKIERVLSTISARGIGLNSHSLMKGKLKDELLTLGYSCSGHVIAVGKKVKMFRTGDFVACAGAGFANHADIVCVPENLAVRIHKEEYLKQASLTTIGTIAMHGLRRANVQIGESVCVWGLGLIGQLTIQLARCAGCSVIGVDLLQDRLDLAKSFGANAVYNANDPEILKEIVFQTNQCGVDATIITAASQNDTIVQQAMHVTRKKGRIIVVGDVNMSLERHPMYNKEIDFMVSCSYGPGRYDQAYEQRSQDYPLPYVRWTENRNMQSFIELMENNRLMLDKLVETEISLDQISQGYEQILQRKKVGVVISYGPRNQQDMVQKIIKPSFVPARRDATSVGIVGVGGFARITLLPIIAKLNCVKINAIVDTDIARSLSTARLYNASKAFVDDGDLFLEDLVDVVVVSSPHKYHCAQLLRALQNGKAVFVEKPLATDFDQHAELKQYLKKNPQSQICIDYHHAFSPFAKQIKNAIANRTSPLMIQYRINAMPLAHDHWMQTEIGAGRIIGDCGNLINLFCYLTDSTPLSVSVEALHSSRASLFPTDNFSVQLHFHDGSICSLIYSSLGHQRMGKERLELFCDGKSIVMQDFIKLTGYGLPASFSSIVKTADTGHEALVTSFFEKLKQPASNLPIPVNDLVMISELILTIDKLACEGGGSTTITQP